MTAGVKHSGEYKGITWEVDATRFDPVILTVRKGKWSESVTYNCKRRPTRDYDYFDQIDMEKILDRLIEKGESYENEVRALHQAKVKGTGRDAVQ